MTALKQLTQKLLIYAGLWLIGGGMPIAIAQGSTEDDALLKAAFVYNFAKFTLWPQSALGAQDTPLYLCVAGSDNLATALEQLGDKRVKGHPLSIQSIQGVRVPKNCQMLYVAASEQQQQPDFIKSVHGLPILTISELPEFAYKGGIIQLYREKERIRFIINQGAARNAGLEINPNLLSLAVVIGQEQTH
jgi:hypothetical protein